MRARTIVTALGVMAVTVTLAACGSDSSGGSDSGSDGSTIASTFVFGAAPEFKTRADGLDGLKKNYGITFKEFKVTDPGGPLTVAALKDGKVQAADLFTTDPTIEANGFVVLEDPKSNFAAQNVLPLINASKADATVTATLNAVSAKLTTEVLGGLRVKVEINKEDPVAVAKAWLASVGLDKPSGTPTTASLIVGSANFSENVVLAQIYAEALKVNGAKITTKLNIGNRETYLPGLKDGSVDLIPEYSGVLLQYFDKNATATTPDDVYAALGKVVPSGLKILDKSSAQDKDSIVVTAETAKKYNLKSIADLAKAK